MKSRNKISANGFGKGRSNGATKKGPASRATRRLRHQMNDFYGNMTVGTRKATTRVWNEELGFFEEIESGMQPDS